VIKLSLIEKHEEWVVMSNYLESKQAIGRALRKVPTVKVFDYVTGDEIMNDKVFDSLLDKALDQAGSLGVAKDLLEAWAEIHDTPCRFDHHGYCQEHYLEDRDDCIVKRTKDFINGN